MSTTAEEQSRNSLAHFIFYTLLISLFVILVAGWWAGNHMNIGLHGSGLIAIARLFGLMAGFAMLVQVTLMSRLPLVDQNFNLHEIVQIHRINGFSIFGLLTLHVSFMTIAYAEVSNSPYVAQFGHLVTTFRGVALALVALILVYISVALSVGAARRRVPYEFWYFVHLTLYAAILLPLFHQVFVGGDIVRDSWFRYYWFGLYILAFAVLLYFRAFRIGLLLFKHDFKIQKIVKEAEGIYSVYIGGRNIEKFKFQPGQYAGWRVLTAATVLQTHPYSFSSLPGQPTLRFTINTADGKFTSKVPDLKPGTRILIDGPRGSFTEKRANTKQIVLIAGGIGVAPYMSLIPDLLQKQHRVDLLYAARTPENVAFGDVLHSLAAKGLKYTPFISSQDQRINADSLSGYDSQETTYFLCGPDPMVVALTATLNAQSVPASRIVMERFSV